jgi:hypothetical protein
MILDSNLKKEFLAFEQIQFAKASPEAIAMILQGLEAEIESAAAQGRTPWIYRGLLQVGLSVPYLEI